MEEFLKAVENLQLDMSSQQVGVLLAMFVVFLSVVLFWLLTRSPSNRNLVLILGVSNSGKTTLFTQLVFNKVMSTQTSMTQNSGTAVFAKTDVCKEKKVEFVDIPGNDKVRKKFFDMHKKNAAALVFVVDSSTLQRDLKDFALYMYEVFTDEQLAKLKMNVLIACNKQDIELAKGESVVRSSLEKEIELLRKLSSSALKSTSESKSATKLAMKSGADSTFSFDDLKYLSVDFEESSFLDATSINKSVGSWVRSRL